jgi:hypothetical protein
MPICERDPWRLQFFENVSCPDNVIIPTDDLDCWPWLPRHRWVYDRLRIAESQGLACAPHGVMPETYPVFSKPIVNLRGMGIGSRIIHSQIDMEATLTAGHFWMPMLTGAHVSTDCAVVQGDIKWIRHATGVPTKNGMFSHWTIHAAEDAGLHRYLQSWLSKNLADYTGMLNIETIGGRIIEMHLRFADQWCDVYGQGWVEALIGLYQHGHWKFATEHRVDSYSIPLFAESNQHYRHPPMNEQARIRALPQVSSLQITFFENRHEELHAMPPGGFRLGIINATDLTAGLVARRAFAKLFQGLRLQIPEPHPTAS